READKIRQDAIMNAIREGRLIMDEKKADARIAQILLAIKQGQEGVDVIPEKARDLHGEEYLATLTPAIAAEVRGLAEGRMNINAMGYRGAARQGMLQRVAQFDPNFDLSNWAARNSMQRAYAGGQEGTNI